jgi:putative selenium metabolism protein SsnA
MKDVTILSNGTLVTGGARPTVIPNGAVVWRDDRILALGSENEFGGRFPDARVLDAHGGLIVPGMVNLHHHFYSALARGLDPGVELNGFGAVLEGLWWRLDRALTSDAVRVSARLTAADCIRWGCTTVFDHHASPSCLRGSLGIIADAVEEAGLSAVLCYEISDRNGHSEALEGIEENLDFCARHREHPRVRATIGLHASFTVSDQTLGIISERRPDGVGCHVHVAEDLLDVRVSKAAYGAGPIERLESFGLLDDAALLVHCVHLGSEQFERIANAGAVVIHNPESNANNGVGRLNVVEAARLGCLVGLGTDGMSSSMLRSLRAAFLAHRSGLRDPRVGFEVHPHLLSNNAVVAARFFDEPMFGELAVDAPADIAVIDRPTPTPLDDANLFPHLVYGAAEAPIRHTIARGQVVLEDFRHTTLDVEAIAAEARQIAPEVWQRFHALPPPSQGDEGVSD